MFRSTEGKVSLFYHERLGRGLWETITLPEVLYMNYRSEFKHHFTNHGYCVASQQESCMSIFFVLRKWHLKLNILKILNSLKSTQTHLKLFFWEKFRKLPSFNELKAFINGHKLSFIEIFIKWKLCVFKCESKTPNYLTIFVQ